MQYSADFIALGTYAADVRAANERIDLLMRAEERLGGGASDAATTSTHSLATTPARRARRSARFAFLR